MNKSTNATASHFLSWIMLLLFDFATNWAHTSNLTKPQSNTATHSKFTSNCFFFLLFCFSFPPFCFHSYYKVAEEHKWVISGKRRYGLRNWGWQITVNSTHKFCYNKVTLVKCKYLEEQFICFSAYLVARCHIQDRI